MVGPVPRLARRSRHASSYTRAENAARRSSALMLPFSFPLAPRSSADVCMYIQFVYRRSDGNRAGRLPGLRSHRSASGRWDLDSRVRDNAKRLLLEHAAVLSSVCAYFTALSGIIRPAGEELREMRKQMKETTNLCVLFNRHVMD